MVLSRCCAQFCDFRSEICNPVIAKHGQHYPMLVLFFFLFRKAMVTFFFFFFESLNRTYFSDRKKQNKTGLKCTSKMRKIERSIFKPSRQRMWFSRFFGHPWHQRENDIIQRKNGQYQHYISAAIRNGTIQTAHNGKAYSYGSAHHRTSERGIGLVRWWCWCWCWCFDAHHSYLFKYEVSVACLLPAGVLQRLRKEVRFFPRRLV